MPRNWVWFAVSGLIACGSTSEGASEPTEKPEPTATVTPTPEPVRAGKGGMAEQVDEARRKIADAPPQGRWTTYQGNNARTGHAPGIEPIRTPAVKWSAEVGIQGYLNGPLVLGSKVVVPTSGSTHNGPDTRDGLHALDVETGKEVWFAKSGSDANGAVAGGGVVVFTSDDTMTRAVDEETGALRWEHSAKATVYSTPLIVDDTVVVGDANGNVIALGLDKGEPRWTHTLSGAIRGGLAADDESIYAVSQAGLVAAFTWKGDVRWKEHVVRAGWDGGPPEPIEGYNAPTVDSGRLIVPYARDTHYSTGAALVALSTRDGGEVWRATPGGLPDEWGNIRSSPAVVDGVVLWAEPYSADVVGLDAATGVGKFRQPAGTCLFPQYGSPVVAGNVAYVPRQDGHLVAVDASSGSSKWRFYLGEHGAAGPEQPVGSGCQWEASRGKPLYAPPALGHDGTIYIGTGEGWLFALTEAR